MAQIKLMQTMEMHFGGFTFILYEMKSDYLQDANWNKVPRGQEFLLQYSLSQRKSTIFMVEHEPACLLEPDGVYMENYINQDLRDQCIDHLFFLWLILLDLNIYGWHESASYGKQGTHWNSTNIFSLLIHCMLKITECDLFLLS